MPTVGKSFDVKRAPTHKVWKYIAIAAALLVVLVIGVLVFMQTTTARTFVVSQVSRLLQHQNVAFSTDDLRYNLFDLQLKLRNVRVQSRDAQELPAFATIERLDVDLSLRHLLRRRFVLQAGDIGGLTIHYLVTADGRDNLPHPPRDPEQPQAPLDYLVEKLAVRNATIRYENRARGFDLTLPVNELQVEGYSLADRHTVTFTSAGGSVTVAQRPFALNQLTGQLDLGRDDIRIPRLELTADGVRMQLTGSIDHFEDPSGDVRLRGEIDAARAAALAEFKDRVLGTVTVDVTAKGPLDAPALEGQVTGRDVAFRNLEHVDVAANGSYDIRARRATLGGFQLRAPVGQIDGSGVVALGDDGRSSVKANASGVDMAAITRSLNSPYTVASRVDANVTAEWPGRDYLKASGAGRARFTPLARAGRNVIPVAGRLDFTGTANALDATISSLRVANADINGRVRVVNQRELGGEARIRVRDVAQTLAAAESIAGRPSGSFAPTAIRGALATDIRLGGTLQSPRATASIRAPALTVGSASGLALDGLVNYTTARLEIPRLDLIWQEARARAMGNIALTGARALDVSVASENLQLIELLRAANQSQIPANGTVSMHARISGTAARPAIDAIVNGAKLTAYGEEWGGLSAKVTVAGQQITVADLLVTKPQPQGDGRILGSATYDFARHAYSADLRSEHVYLVSLTLPNGRRVRGDVEFTARVSGASDRPAGTVRLTGNNLRVDQYAVGSLTVNADVANQQANITVSVPTYGVTAKALTAIARPFATTAQVKVENLELATLPLDLKTPLEGRVRATVDASGPLATPERLQASAVVDAFTGEWNQQPFSIAGPARLRYFNERLAIDQLRVVAQDSTIDVNGELPVTDRGAAGAIAVDARGNLATLVRYAPAGSTLAGSGDVRVAGTIRGTLQRIDPELSIDVTNATLASAELRPGLANLTLSARVANGEALVEQLTGNWGQARLSASGRIPFEALPALPVDMPRRGGPATFRAALEGLNVAEVPRAPSGLGGRVSVSAEMSATRADLAALAGQITFPELRLTFNGLTLDQLQPSVIGLANGTARIERLALSGSVGNLTANGTVDLRGDRVINVDTRGNLNVAALTLFADAVRADGEAELNVLARGTIAAPDLNGFVHMRSANFVVDQPTIAAENVNARLVLSGRRISVAQLTGTLNGGTLSGSAYADLGTGGIADLSLEISTNNVAFDAPLDLRSLSDARVIVRRREDEYLVEGQITLDEGGLTGDVNFDEGLLAAIQARHRLDLTEKRNPFLERVRFNLDVDTATPVIVDNNLARAEVAADLRIIGTPYEPGLAGRLTVLEGGEITLNERRYEVERGTITFIGERRILPSFDLRLNTTVRNYDVTIAVTGSPGDTETTLTSEPTLPEPDIMAVLATGRTLDEMRGEEFEIAREQALSYLTGRLGSQLGRGAERATGFDTVRLEPNLIANETDPTARLTVGEDIADNLELIYSVSLTDSNDQIWVAEYDVTRRFQTRAVRQNDNSYRMDLRHDVRIGGQPAPARVKRQRPVVASVSISGDGKVPESEVRQWLGLEEGDDFDFFAARSGVEEIGETLQERGFLQSRVRLGREGDARAVGVVLNVVAGPRVQLQFDGVTPPAKVLEDIATKWRRGVFDTQRLDDSRDVLRAWLMKDNYLQPSIEGAVEEVGPDERRVHLSVTPGTRSTRVVLAFEGVRGIAGKELQKIIGEQNLDEALFTDPTQVTELIERYYREEGYLVADVAAPRYEFNGTTARVVLPINEGPRFVVGTVTAKGPVVVPADTLVGELPVQSGDPFLPFAAENALQHIRDVYWQRGYNDVRSDYALVLDRAAGRVDVRFDVTEGPRSVIADITVQGNQKTSEHLVREQVELQPGQPLDLSALARSRKNLYETQAFSIVDIKRAEPQPAIIENGDATKPVDQPAEDKPVQLNISVREVQPIQLRYGASYDTERGVGGIFDVSNHNSLGKARVIGFRSRYDGEVRDFRGYMSQPSLRYWPIVTTANLYYRDERNPVTTLTNPFNVDRRGASMQQERKLGNAYVWNWGFRYERARTFDPVLNETVEDWVTVTPLTTSLTWETRDEVLDATRGSFSSHAFAYAPSWLGSDQAFIKYFGQYFHYIPLQRARRERFTNEILRPRFVYAGGVRLGIARPFGGNVPRSERFLAGGSTTLRGFEQNAVGGVDLAGVPLGGDALFVINNEVRFPLVSIVDGVVFNDIGNVFSRISEFSLSDLRKTAGVGLRLRTRWFLVRGDYGLVLDRRDGEPRGRFYFSLGQAF